MYFTIDSAIAASILITVIVLLPLLNSSTVDVTEKSEQTQDVMNVLATYPIKLLNSQTSSPTINQSIAAGTITNTNISVLEQIGTFWVENQQEKAINLTREVLEPLIPEGTSYGVYLNNQPIYIRNISAGPSLTLARRIASGYQEGKPVLGFSTKAYLSGISSRRASSYAFFGGFIGEGNITVQLELPNNLTELTEGVLELDSGTDFALWINNQKVADFAKESGDGGYLIPDKWLLNSEQLGMLKEGLNNITLRFGFISENATGNGPNAVSGGYLKVDYETTNIDEVGVTYLSNTSAKSRYYLPAIEGFINIYDAFYVPGNLTKLTLHLHYNHPYTLFVKMGSASIFEENSSGENTRVIANNELEENLSAAGYEYINLSQKTIPLRIGFKDVTRIVSAIDIVLGTDISNRMARKMADNTHGTDRECSDPLLNDPNTNRISPARCADLTFIGTVMNNIGPKIGLLSYSTATESIVNLTTNTTALNAEVNLYTPTNDNCICCVINSAIEIFKANTNIFNIPRSAPNWKYFDTGSDPVDDWYSTGYDDSSWGTGEASFGSGSYGERATTVAKYVGNYYYRKEFTINSTTNISSSSVFLSSDDYVAKVYVNGIEIGQESSGHEASYWNKEFTVNTSVLKNGTNILAVKVYNTCIPKQSGCSQASSTYFDAELITSKENEIDARQKVLILMSNAETNKQCQQEQGTGSSVGDAIAAGCSAFTDHSITIHTVGFGPEKNDATLQQIATCANGDYYNASNAEELEEVYNILAEKLITYTETQKANFSGTNTTYLYSDSYLEYEYEPEIPQRPAGKIPVSVETDQFGNSIGVGTMSYPGDKIITKVSGISYSGPYWTSTVSVQNTNGLNEVYNLSKISEDFHEVGDPYRIQISPLYFLPDETNTVTISTGISPNNATESSPANKLIYDMWADSSTGFGSAFFTNEGCKWNITYNDNTSEIVAFPSEYTGNRTCDFKTRQYDTNNAADDAAYRLFDSLDFDDDGILTIKFGSNQLHIETLTADEVPTLWGPAVIEVRIW